MNKDGNEILTIDPTQTKTVIEMSQESLKRKGLEIYVARMFKSVSLSLAFFNEG